MGKDKRSKKEKKEKKNKKRRKRDSSESSSPASSDDSERNEKHHKLALKISKHLQKRQVTGDDSGTQPFVWAKKIEKELHSGKTVRDYTVRAEQERQQQRMDEIAKVRTMREARDAEKVRQEEELSMIARERAVAEAIEVEAKEEEFYLRQLVDVAAVRITEGRAKPVDRIAAVLHLAGKDDLVVDLREPWTYFEGMMLADVEDLHDGISQYAEIDKYDPLHVAFWKSLLEIAEIELTEARRLDEQDRHHLQGAASAAASGAGAGSYGALRPESRGLHPALERDIEGMLTGQTVTELETLETKVGEILRGGEGDPEYWEEVGRRLKIHKAKAVVRSIQSQVLRRQLDALAARREKEMAEVEKAESLGTQSRETSVEPGTGAAAANLDWRQRSTSPGMDAEAGPSGAPGVGNEEEAEEEDEDEDENDGRYSPPPVDPESVAGMDVVPEEEDRAQLELMRRQVGMVEARRFVVAETASKSKRLAAAAEADRAYRDLLADGGRSRVMGVHPMLRNIADAAPGLNDETGFRTGRLPVPEGEEEDTGALRAAALRVMGSGEGDAPFGGEVPLEAKVYWWHEKYRPRKPKYFNRVHTGYEWNKYNQTHYDHDNPPPKVVQGYKFNIFYPELIDKNATPTFRLSPDPKEEEEMEIITFSAGPPYEDIAFRIVRKEWEYSHKRGYKCTFERGILHLYFNFRRARYRR